MESLDLSSGNIGSIQFGETQPHHELNLSNNPLSSLRFLAQFPNLTTLNLSNSHLSNALLLQIPLSLVQTLRELDLSNNSLITSVSALPDFPSLTYLNLDDTGLSSSSQQFSQSLCLLEKLYFDHTMWNSLKVWEQLEYNRNSAGSDQINKAVCELSCSQIDSTIYSVGLKVALPQSETELLANIRVYKIDDSSIEQLINSNFSAAFSQQLQIEIDSMINPSAENVYIAVSLTIQGKFQLALLNLWQCEIVPVQKTIQDRQNILDLMYKRPNVFGPEKCSRNMPGAGVQFVNLNEGAPLALQPELPDCKIYRSVLTGWQIISLVKNLVSEESQHCTVSSKDIASMFFKALQSQNTRIIDSGATYQIAVQMLMCGQQREYAFDVEAVNVGSLLQLDKLYAVQDLIHDTLIFAPSFIQRGVDAGARKVSPKLVQQRDKFSVIVEFDDDPGSILYQFFCDDRQIQKGYSPYLYSKTLLALNEGLLLKRKLYCVVMSLLSHSAFTTNSLVLNSEDIPQCDDDEIQSSQVLKTSTANNTFTAVPSGAQKTVVSNAAQSQFQSAEIKVRPSANFTKVFEQEPCTQNCQSGNFMCKNIVGPEKTVVNFSKTKNSSPIADVSVVNRPDYFNDRRVQCVVQLQQPYDLLFQLFSRNKELGDWDVPELYISMARVDICRKSDACYLLDIYVSDFDCGSLLYLYIFDSDNEIKALYQLTDRPFTLTQRPMVLHPNDFINFDCLLFSHRAHSTAFYAKSQHEFNTQHANIKLQQTEDTKYMLLDNFVRFPLHLINVYSIDQKTICPTWFFGQQLYSRQLNLLELCTIRQYSVLKANGFGQLAMTENDWEHCAMLSYFGFAWVLFFDSTEQKFGFVWAVAEAQGKHWSSRDLREFDHPGNEQPDDIKCQAVNVLPSDENVERSVYLDQECRICSDNMLPKNDIDQTNQNDEMNSGLRRQFIIQVDCQGLVQYADAIRNAPQYIPHMPQYDSIVVSLLTRYALDYSKVTAVPFQKLLTHSNQFTVTGKTSVSFLVYAFDGINFDSRECTANFKSGKLVIGGKNVKINDVHLYRSDHCHLLMYNVITYDRVLIKSSEEQLEFLQQLFGVFQK